MFDCLYLNDSQEPGLRVGGENDVFIGDVEVILDDLEALIGDDVFHAAGIFIGCGCDAVSAWGHICVVHGWKSKPSDVWKFLKRFAVAIVKKKSDDVGEALEETIDKEQNMED